MTTNNNDGVPAIVVSSLSYTFPDDSPGLKDISLTLPPRSRTLLIGANGAGKTTLLRLLSGKRMAPSRSISIHGHDPFSTALESVTYLGAEWVLNPIVRADIAVPVLLASVGGDAYPSRRDELLRVLDIDTRWRMHAVSDGERRRVQLAMGLLRPWRVLLLDEITVDLDLLSRARFLDWLKAETEGRDACVVYATHILDNLALWPSHVVHMSLGRVKKWGTLGEMVGGGERNGDGEVKVAKGVDKYGNSPLGDLVLRWLEEDLEERGPRGAGLGQAQSAQAKSLGIGGDEVGGYGLEKRPDWK